MYWWQENMTEEELAEERFWSEDSCDLLEDYADPDEDFFEDCEDVNEDEDETETVFDEIGTTSLGLGLYRVTTVDRETGKVLYITEDRENELGGRFTEVVFRA